MIEKELDDTVETAAAVVDNSEQSVEKDDESVVSCLQCNVMLTTKQAIWVPLKFGGEVKENLFHVTAEAVLGHAVH